MEQAAESFAQPGELTLGRPACSHPMVSGCDDSGL
jgi:hypothetical protein